MRLCKICKGVTAFIMTIVLALGGFSVPVFAANSDIGLSFSLTEVKGDVTTVELGLHVKTDGEEQFKAVGTVLEFDNTVLSLIPWNTYVSYATEGADGWDKALPIGTKGVDEYMSSFAQAYNDGGKTYLYLGAEAIVPTAVGNGEQVVTVRFAYRDGKSGTDITNDTIKLAESDPVVFASPVGNGVAYSNGEVFYYHNPLTTDDNGDVIADNDVSAEQIIAPPAFDTLKEGESIAGTTGGSKEIGAVSVAFYDWDETLLGVLAVAENTDITAEVNEYVKNFVHSELRDNATSVSRADTYRGKYPSEYGNAETVDLTGSGYPLTNKLDYVFYKGDTTDGNYFAHGWIPVTAATLDGRETDGVFTAYSTADEVIAAEPVDFSKGISESIMVKAAYVEGESINGGTGGITSSYYTVTDMAYNRYGTVTETSGSYSIKATVERINADGYGVTRMKTPVYRVAITPQGENVQDVLVKVTLDSKDVATGESVVTKTTDVAKIVLVDSATNWVEASYKTNQRNVSHQGDDGFIILGTIQGINDAAAELFEDKIDNAEFLQIFNDITYSDIGIDVSDFQGTKFTRDKITCNKFRLAYVATNGNFDLEYIKGFITNKDITAVKLQNTDGYERALESVKSAVKSNGGKPLTATETINAINNIQ